MTLEGGCEDGTAKALGAALGLGDGGGECLGAREVAVNFGDDPFLLSERRHWDWDALDVLT